MIPIEEGNGLHVVHPGCCGMDGHPAQRSACLRRVRDAGTITRNGGTLAPPMISSWPCAQGSTSSAAPRRAREHGGILEPHLSRLGADSGGRGGQCPLGPPAAGPKTDQADAAWRAELFAHGLVAPRCIPPPAVQAWRGLDADAGRLVQTRTQAREVFQNLQRVLQAAAVIWPTSSRSPPILRASRISRRLPKCASSSFLANYRPARSLSSHVSPSPSC